MYNFVVNVEVVERIYNIDLKNSNKKDSVWFDIKNRVCYLSNILKKILDINDLYFVNIDYLIDNYFFFLKIYL